MDDALHRRWVNPPPPWEKARSAPATNDNAETSSPEYAYTPSSNECLNREINIEEVLKQINRLKNGKAHGEDMIINEFLKIARTL